MMALSLVEKLGSLDCAPGCLGRCAFCPFDAGREAAAEISRLTERCEAYKGQIEAGAAEIARLTSELEQARKREIVVRWEPEGNPTSAFVGDLFFGRYWLDQSRGRWVIINRHGFDCASFQTEPEARAAVEAAALSALGGRGE